MEKLMISYLNISYPKAYVYKSKFGNLMYNMDKELHFERMIYTTYEVRRIKVVEQLESLFSCSNYLAELVYHNWLSSRPIYECLINSTNENILVPVKTVTNTTV